MVYSPSIIQYNAFISSPCRKIASPGPNSFFLTAPIAPLHAEFDNPAEHIAEEYSSIIDLRHTTPFTVNQRSELIVLMPNIPALPGLVEK